MNTQDPNPPPQIGIQDILALTVFVLIRLPYTILKTTLHHLIGTPNRPPLLKDLTRSLIRETFSTLPISIHNTLPNKKGSKALLSTRYSTLKTHLFHKIQRPNFTGYWVCRGLLPTTAPIDPKKADLVIYHLRGSGYALGHPADTLPGLLFLAEVLEKKGIRVCIFTLDYTLVMNGSFPKQIWECFAGYEYLIGEVGVGAERVCLMGESAGGHLALALLVTLARGFGGSFSFSSSLDGDGDGDEDWGKKERVKEKREEGYPRPGSLILLSPWIDLSLSSPVVDVLEKKDFMSRSFLRRMGRELLRSDPGLSSLFGDFASRSMEKGSWGRILPCKTWVSAGGDEIFVNDIVRFVDCTREDGVEVELRVEPGKCHSWQSGEAFLSARRFLDMSIQCEGVELMPGLVGVAGVIAGFV